MLSVAVAVPSANRKLECPPRRRRRRLPEALGSWRYSRSRTCTSLHIRGHPSPHARPRTSHLEYAAVWNLVACAGRWAFGLPVALPFHCAHSARLILRCFSGVGCSCVAAAAASSSAVVVALSDSFAVVDLALAERACCLLASLPALPSPLLSTSTASSTSCHSPRHQHHRHDDRHANATPTSLAVKLEEADLSQEIPKSSLASANKGEIQYMLMYL